MTATRSSPKRAAPRAGAEPAGASRASSDGRRVRFEVLVDGTPFACAISHHALRDMASGGKRPGAGDLLQCFASARPRLEALALRKIRARRGAPQGVLYIWPEDEETPEPPPPAGSQASDPAPTSAGSETPAS